MLLMEECIELLNAVDLPTWTGMLVNAGQKLGYSRVLFGLKPGKDSSNSTAIITGNFPPKWRSQYDQENFASVDPTVRHSFSSTLPLAWTGSLYRSDAELRFAEEVAGVGLSYGLTLPIHGPQGQVGMLSLSCDPMPDPQYRAHVVSTLGPAGMLRDYAALSGAKLISTVNPDTPRLTARELEMLRWARAGKTSWEIGIILSLSEPTIEFHFKNIRRKLNVSSRRLAVVRSIQLDLIAP